MKNFTYYNPVRIVFGKGEISRLPELLPVAEKVLFIYGGGSIKENGTYKKVKQALNGYSYWEFSGIEPNPEYETCLKAISLALENQVTFILAVGGGSVIDAAKFIAAAVPYSDDPWKLLAEGAPFSEALHLGTILTLPATGSEMNMHAVISRRSLHAKRSLSNPLIYPQFSILDPELTFSLPQKQVVNGIIDAFIHTTEQYITYPENAALQERQAEAILLTLIDEGQKGLPFPYDYNARANIMWAATSALNTVISCGVSQDWATHVIGHEMTALFGLEHARSLAVILPALWLHQKNQKQAKLAQYGRRVWKLQGEDETVADAAIEATRTFFEALGVPTRLSAYGISIADTEVIVEALTAQNFAGGELGNITPEVVRKILILAK